VADLRPPSEVRLISLTSVRLQYLGKITDDQFARASLRATTLRKTESGYHLPAHLKGLQRGS